MYIKYDMYVHVYIERQRINNVTWKKGSEIKKH